MKKRSIEKIIIVSLMFILFRSVSYCEGTIKMQVVSEGALWNNITVSESYAECEKLNSTASTLGTTGLEAHLTTDADWSAMAILSVSQYGGSTSNAPAQTTGNKSGIYNLGNYVQTTGLLETATSTSTSYISGLFDGNNVKPYVRKWSTDRLSTNFVGFIDTWGWYSSENMWGTYGNHYMSIKNGLFGTRVGDNYWLNIPASGRLSNMTFRPVIWN